jgi:hypothetical protein
MVRTSRALKKQKLRRSRRLHGGLIKQFEQMRNYIKQRWSSRSEDENIPRYEDSPPKVGEKWYHRVARSLKRPFKRAYHYYTHRYKRKNANEGDKQNKGKTPIGERTSDALVEERQSGTRSLTRRHSSARAEVQPLEKARGSRGNSPTREKAQNVDTIPVEIRDASLTTETPPEFLNELDYLSLLDLEYDDKINLIKSSIKPGSILHNFYKDSELKNRVRLLSWLYQSLEREPNNLSGSDADYVLMDLKLLSLKMTGREKAVNEFIDDILESNFKDPKLMVYLNENETNLYVLNTLTGRRELLKNMHMFRDYAVVPKDQFLMLYRQFTREKFIAINQAANYFLNHNFLKSKSGPLPAEFGQEQPTFQFATQSLPLQLQEDRIGPILHARTNSTIHFSPETHIQQCIDLGPEALVQFIQHPETQDSLKMITVKDVHNTKLSKKRELFGILLGQTKSQYGDDPMLGMAYYIQPESIEKYSTENLDHLILHILIFLKMRSHDKAENFDGEFKQFVSDSKKLLRGPKQTIKFVDGEFKISLTLSGCSEKSLTYMYLFQKKDLSIKDLLSDQSMLTDRYYIALDEKTLELLVLFNENFTTALVESYD